MGDFQLSMKLTIYFLLFMTAYFKPLFIGKNLHVYGELVRSQIKCRYYNAIKIKIENV